MKKLLFSMLLVLLVAAPCLAKTYTVSTASGTSVHATAPNGGVSTFEIGGVSGSYDLYPQLDRVYAYGFAMSQVSPTASVSMVDWSGVTFSVFVKFKSEDSNVPWEAIEPTYLFKDVAANSGTTPEIRWVYVPPADLARIYFVSEGGTTPFDRAIGKLIASEVPLDVPDSRVLIPASPAFYVVNTSSGVSTMTIPAGASKTYVRVSGSDIRYTLDGTTPDAASSMVLSQDQILEIVGRNAAQAFKFRETTGGSGSTVYPTHTNERK